MAAIFYVPAAGIDETPRDLDYSQTSLELAILKFYYAYKLILNDLGKTAAIDAETIEKIISV